MSATTISTKRGKKKLEILPDRNTGYWKIPPAAALLMVSNNIR